jgi:hypothetical protein
MKSVTVASNNFSIITEVFPYIRKYVSVHINQAENRQQLRFTGHFRIVGLASCHPVGPEFGGGS